MGARVAVLVLISSAFGWSDHASAQEIGYQRIPIGNRAVGMGGAYTGIAEDLSAVWYNPGGLAFPEGATISGGFTLNAYDDYRIMDGYGFGESMVDLDDDGSISIPFFVGGMAKLGDADEHDGRRHALAVSAVNPSTASRRMEASIAVPTDGSAAALRLRSRDSLQQYGPSYAYRISDDFGIGMSAYLSIHELDYEESEVITQAGARRPDGTFASSSIAARLSSAEATVISVLFRIGALWRPLERFRVGLMLQVPNLPLYREGRVQEFMSEVDAGGVGRFSDSQKRTTSPYLSQPFEARLGLGYQPLDNWRLAADFSIYAPTGSRGSPNHLFGEIPVDPATTEGPTPGRFISNEIWTETSFNVAAGMETLIADVVPLSLGVYTDLAPTPSIETASPVYRPPHIDKVGVTAVVGYRSGGYNFAFGGALVLGWGRALANDPGAPAAEAYVPRDARQTSLYIFFTGYSEAAETLARDTGAFTVGGQGRDGGEDENRDEDGARESRE